MTEQSLTRKERDLSLTRRGLMPRTLSEVTRLAQGMVRAGIAPKGMTMDAAVGVMLAGLEIGLGPIQALQSISFISGRPCLYGDGVSALLLQSGQLEALPEETFEGDGEELTAICRLKRRGMDGVIERRFSWQDAERAQLVGKDNWRMYPRRMLRWRAFSMAARDGFADVLKGIWVREEAEDMLPTIPIPKEVPLEPEQPRNALPPATPEQPIETAPPEPVATAAGMVEPDLPAEPDRVRVVPTENAEDEEHSALWAIWEDYRGKLTDEQLREVRKRSGIGRIGADLGLENLRNVITKTEDVLGI